MTHVILTLIALALMAGCAPAAPTPPPTTDETAAASTRPPATLAVTAPVTTPTAPFDALLMDSLIAQSQTVLSAARAVTSADLRPEVAAHAEALRGTLDTQITQLQAWRADWYPDAASTTGLPANVVVIPLSEDETVPLELRYLNTMISAARALTPLVEVCASEAEREELHTACAALGALLDAEQLEAWRAEGFPASG